MILLDKLLYKKKNNTTSRISSIDPSESRIIQCPYCFKKFSHEDVHFKAMTIKSAADWEGSFGDFGVKEDEIDPFGNTAEGRTNSNADDFGIKEDEADPFGSSEEEASESEPHRLPEEYARLFQEKEDTLFKKFWQRYANTLSWEYATYPVITKSDTQMIKGTYREDGDGMVFSVTDRYGMETRERICPYCHNPLPANYGKYPVYFIATVGITSSGKTVYLSQLFKGMDEYMSNVNLASLGMSSSINEFLKNHPIEKNIPLPLGTARGILNPPLFYAILDKNAGYTLVFYDVAGEDCVKADEMTRYGPFIENADGILMILDPEQFSQVNLSNDIIASPKTVIDTMFKSFLGHGKTGEKSEVPLALALSKSDTLEDRNLFPSNSNIFKDLDYDTGYAGFDLRQYRNLAGEVRRFLSNMPEGRATLNVIEHCFLRTGFFAFSALNCEVKKIQKEMNGLSREVPVPSAHPAPRRIEEPLFWMLSEFGILPKIESTPR